MFFIYFLELLIELIILSEFQFQDTFGRKDSYNDGKEPDHYMNRVRAEAQERDDDDDDDDEESEDSDFNPDAAGASDVAEE